MTLQVTGFTQMMISMSLAKLLHTFSIPTDRFAPIISTMKAKGFNALMMAAKVLLNVPPPKM